ncbi:CCA tRNA nucleotidyltransferase [Peptostreptococcus canis]|uniref:CCA tRNA nucleotidyltransferase n=1 Tax=Peptostreptococcus canis TaxID=1159213 RepID=A0ABR6TMT1_9FIRM|nr:CCA tRNA nucleotidyltransferase [Peptostreptococcus canis]MBC2576533.1 CCA tRNA nucleotidyltransferase [Peptostreptococcus canis]MBP1998717.1 tRNA nucleotidyltransferase (CCA-adding enzyme) [Peptostreptococcus canis]
MLIKIEKGAKYIIEKIIESGFEAFIVGGCVRDSIMGRKPNDWDITTSAKPQDIMSIFKKTIPTGIAHGTVTVMIDKVGYEVTTYRIDGEYSDMRRPESVKFSDNIIDDLSRRDFTVNAMAYNDKKGLIDIFGGLDDINKKKIRCVGNPELRFNEDALRIIRAIRFSAKLGFSIDDNTYKSMLKNADNIKKVSIERITSEFEGIIKYSPCALTILNELGVCKWLFDGFDFSEESITNAQNIINIYKKTNTDDTYINENYEFGDIFSIENAKYINVLTRAVCFGHIDNYILINILRKLRYSNKDIVNTKKIHSIYLNEKYDALSDENINKNTMRVMMKEIMRDLEDILLSKYAIYSKFIKKNQNLGLCFAIFNDIIESGECFSISHLQINGRDVIENDIAKGPEIGELLNYLLDYVIKNPKANKKEELLNLARNRYN